MEDGIIVSEIGVSDLISHSKGYNSFKPIPIHPPQIEDLTIKIPEGVEVGKVIDTIKSAGSNISEVELWDIFKDSYTFRVSYQDPAKTLTDIEVQYTRNVILQKIKAEFNI